MGLKGWIRRGRRTTPPHPATTIATFSWAPGSQPFLPGGTYVGTTMIGQVTRAEALSVPAVKRGRDMICSLASLPLRMVDREQNVVTDGRASLLAQIDPSTANVVTLAQTLDDLIFEGVAWWQVLARDAAGFPVSARHIDTRAVSTTPPPGYSTSTLPSGIAAGSAIWIMGRPVRAQDMIRFDSSQDPVCVVGARVIRRALKLAQTSEMYSDDPEARAYWRPTDGIDPGEQTDIEDAVRRYIEARRRGAEAYIPAALERVVAPSVSAVDIQLDQRQQRSDLEIANLMGLDPEDLGVNTTSRTYANAVDRRIDRLNTVYAPYMRSITDRLSLGDVSRRGTRVEFDLDDYLKADPATRWATYATAVDKGILSVAEIRHQEGWADVPVEIPQTTQTIGVAQ